MMCHKCGQPQFVGGAGYAGRQCLCVGQANHPPVQHARVSALAAEIERLRADRDCEKRLRKDSDDLATDLRLALEAVMSRPSDTGLAWAVLERINGVGSGGVVGPNTEVHRQDPALPA